LISEVTSLAQIHNRTLNMFKEQNDKTTKLLTNSNMHFSFLQREFFHLREVGLRIERRMISYKCDNFRVAGVRPNHLPNPLPNPLPHYFNSYPVRPFPYPNFSVSSKYSQPLSKRAQKKRAAAKQASA